MPTRRPDEAAQTQVAPETPSLAAPEQQAAAVGEQPWLLYDPEVSQVMHAATTQGWQPDQLRSALQGSKAFQEINERRQALADPERGQQTRQELALEVSNMTGRAATDPLVMDMAGKLENGQATMAALKGLTAPMNPGTPQSRVLEIARAHGIPMSPQAATQWASMPEAEIDGQLAQMSQSLHPWKPANLPYRQVAGIFADLKSQELGRRIDPEDPRLNDLIAQSQGQLGPFRQMVRDLPEWADTPQAKELIQQRQDQVMQSLLSGDATDDSLAQSQQLMAGMAPLGQPQEQPAMPSQAQGSGGPALANLPPMKGDAKGADGIVGAAMKYLGTPYVWGGESLSEGGLDCSGFVQVSAADRGIEMPRTAKEQSRVGVRVPSLDQAQPGDLLYWDHGDGQHIAIYMGGGKMIHAPHTGDVVRVSNVYGRPMVRRVAGLGSGQALAAVTGTAPTGDTPVPQQSPFGNYGLRDNPDPGLQDLASGGQQAQSFAGPMVGGVQQTSGGDWQGTLSPAEQWILQRESSMRPDADNPTSTAFGLGQLLLANRIKYLGSDYNTTDPNKQLEAFRSYVRDRYGSAERAKNFWSQNGWY